MTPLVKKALIRDAWGLFKKHWQVLIGGILIIWAVSLVLDAFGKTLDNALAELIVAVVSIAISVILQIGYTRIVLDVIARKPVAIEQLIGDKELALRYFGASLLLVLIVFVGFLLLIVPGFVWAIKYSQTTFAIVDKRMGVMESLRYSASLTNGHKGNLFLLILLVVAINILGMLAFFVGLLVTAPLTAVVYGLVYTTLRNRSEGAVPAAETGTIAAGDGETETPEPSTSPAVGDESTAEEEKAAESRT